MAEKWSLYYCSSTPEAIFYFEGLKPCSLPLWEVGGLSHLPDGCMVSHKKITTFSENTISGDSFSVLHFYAELDPSTRVYY